MSEIREEEKGTGQKVDHMYSFTGSILVPLGIAFVWAFIVTGALFILIGFDKINMLGFYFSPVKPISLIGLLVLGLTWKWEVDQRRQNIKASFIQKVETIFNTDLDGDGYAGVPQEKKRVVHDFHVNSNNGTTQNRYGIEWDEGNFWQIVEVAKRTVIGVTFAQKNYISGDGKIFNLSVFNNLKTQLLNMTPPLLRKVDARANSAVDWTKEGDELMRLISAQNESPRPPSIIVEGEAVEI